MRRLLHVFPTFAVGGAQMRSTAIANHFGDRYVHMVVALDGRMECRPRLASALDVSFPSVQVARGATLRNVHAFRDVLRTLRPDVLVTSNWGSIEWAMANALVGVPHVHLEDGFGPEERDRQIPRRALTRRLVLRRATVVLPSRTLWAIATGIWKLPERRLRYVPNGVDLTRFAPNPARAADIPVIGTVAALRAEKNIGRLLRAAARIAPVREFRVVIVGDGPDRAALAELAASLGIGSRVTFAGAQADPAPIYRAFDIFALSSDTEQMPLSVLEAMATGLPVASTDVGDVRAMLADVNAPYVVPRDDEALAAALLALLDNRAGRLAVGAANRLRAERQFDQDAMFAAYGDLFG